MQTNHIKAAHTDPPAAATALAPARLPHLSDQDRHLLHNYIACREDAVQLAAHSSLPYLDIIDFTSRPDIAAWINHIRELRTRARRDAALDELEKCVRTSRDPIERRRAATTILRATDPARLIRSSKRAPGPERETSRTSTTTDNNLLNEPAAPARNASSDTPPANTTSASAPEPECPSTSDTLASSAATADIVTRAATSNRSEPVDQNLQKAPVLPETKDDTSAIPLDIDDQIAPDPDSDLDEYDDDDLDLDDDDDDDDDENYNPAEVDELISNPDLRASIIARAAARIAETTGSTPPDPPANTSPRDAP